ncbi:MAG: tyrosine-type recombinase/integrase [Planctomycetota bacterium]|nr:tyrosine-type recombinase/integrase [Planctomycetota bacterium]
MNDEPSVSISTYRRKDGKVSYYLRWPDSETGKLRSKSVGTDKKLAREERTRLQDKLREGSFFEAKRICWADFAADHVDAMKPGVNRDEAERTLRHFSETCKPAGPHHVTYQMIERYVSSLRSKNSPATINKRLRYLRMAFNKAVKRKHIAVSPVEGDLFEEEPKRVPRALDKTEKAILLDACPTFQWRVFVALTTGCRRNELLTAKWSGVDFEGETIRVIGKRDRERIQPLHSKAVPMLRELQESTLRDGGPFAGLGRPGWVSEQFRKIVKAAGIARCTIHDLRRTFCTDLARMGVNQLVVQRLAAHECGRTTAVYYQHIDDGTKRDAVQKLA